MKIRILAILLALAMVFSLSSCCCCCPSAEELDYIFDIDDIFGDVSGSENESVNNSVKPNDSTPVESSDASEDSDSSENPDDSEEKPYRETISRSREEMEAMITISDEDFIMAEDYLKAFESVGCVSDNYDEVDAAYLLFEEVFLYIRTQVSIASIIYNIDMSDEAASERYLDLYGRFGDIYNLYADACKNIYNQSAIRDEIFADWTEEEIAEMLAYDPETQELNEANEALLVELNELGEGEFNDRAAAIYAQIVTNNNRIAELSGYDNYYVYASEKLYKRDYGVEDVENFAYLVREYYVPNYDNINNNWMNRYQSLPTVDAYVMYNYLFMPFDQLEKNYLEGYISSFEGSMAEGLGHMFANRNVVFSDSENSHPSAFQTYLTSLEIPFCLFGSQGQSTDTIVHEMGHYYAALYNPDLISMDLAETQSQGNEMLLLAYLKGEMESPIYRALRGYTLYMYMVESIACVIIDDFEREVYSLDSVEGYTSEDFDAIMASVCEKYGGTDFVNNNIVDINYYWRMVATNNPVYYISYAVSMTEALNIFALAENDSAAGREAYRIIVEDINEDDGFLTAMGKAGLSSPFEETTFKSIVAIMLK